MKKIIVITLCGLMAISFVACEGKTQQKDTNISSEDSTQIPNPFVDCETLEGAEQIAGFEITLPETMPEGFNQNAILVIENDLIEVIYNNNEDDKIYIRKAKGNEDISGDYNEYKEQNTIKVGNLDVTTKGNDGMISVAIWNDGDYAYAIGVSNDEKGIDSSTMTDMIKSMK